MSQYPIVAVAVLSIALVAPAQADMLAPFLGLARPVVVLTDHLDDPRFVGQIEALAAQTPALAGYDVTVVRVTTADAALRRKLGVAPKGFAVALVGKDGTVKKTWSEPVDPARIFALIDRMPMRRDEVRRR